MRENSSRTLENATGEIRTKNARIRLEDGIVMVNFVPGAEEILADAEENMLALEKICRGEKKPVYINPGPHKSMTRDARVYYVKESPRYSTAIAVLARSPIAKLLSTFLIALNKTINKDSMLLRFFTSEDEALRWLRPFTME